MTSDVLTSGFGGFVAWGLFHLSTRQGAFSLRFSRERAVARRGERLGSVSFPERTHGPEEGVPSTAARVAMEMRAEVYGRRAA